MLLQGPSYDTRRPLRKRRQEPDNAGFCQRGFDAPFVPLPVRSRVGDAKGRATKKRVAK